MAEDASAVLETIFDSSIDTHRRFSGYGLTQVAAAAAAISRAVTGGRKNCVLKWSIGM